MRLTLALLCLASVTACAEFPELDTAISAEARRAPFPELVPIGPILERRNDARTDGTEAEALEARAAALRARARLLRGATINDETRQRLTPRLEALGG